MPQQAWSDKRERQYEHIKDGLRERGENEDTAEEIAARTVNKERARAGEAKAGEPHVDRRHLVGPPRRPALAPRARAGAPATSSTTRPSRKGIKGRSKMNKAAARAGRRPLTVLTGRCACPSGHPMLAPPPAGGGPDDGGMSFTIDFSHIEQNRPFPVNTDRLVYNVTNNGPDDPGHQDYVQMWDSDGMMWLDQNFDAPQSAAGGSYGVFLDVTPLSEGYYDLAVTLPDGTALGTTVIVQ